MPQIRLPNASSEPALPETDQVELDPQQRAALMEVLQGISSEPEQAAKGSDAATVSSSSSTEKLPEESMETMGLRFCPRCHWDLSRTSVVEVTPEDKQQFLLSIVSDRPFYKTYDLFKGKVKLRLRSLTTLEQEETYRQAMREAESEPGESPLDQVLHKMSRVMRYRALLMLSRLECEGVEPWEFPASLDEWKAQAPAQRRQSGLFDLIRQTVFGQALRSEPLAQCVLAQVQHFEELQRVLTANAGNPDFF